MRFLRGAKRGLHAKVQLHRATPKPSAAARARLVAWGFPVIREVLRKSGAPTVRHQPAWLVERDRYRKRPRRKLP
jgi:hypothetical protein